MVMPRCFSSGALSICSKATAWLAGSSGTRLASTLVIAAVKVVLPWSTWPMVPTFRCGFVLSNLPLAIILLLPLGYLGRDALGHLSIVIELHGERRAALRLTPDGRRVTEHFGERHHRPDDLPASARVHTLDLPTSGAQVAHNVAHELLRYDYLDVHDRLQQDRICPLETLFYSHAPRDLKRHLRGVDIVVRAVHELDLDVHDREPGYHAVVERVLKALVHAGYVLARDDATDDLVLELVSTLVVVLDVDDRVPVLAATAGLPHETTLDVLDPPADRLPVRHLRLADVRVHPELAQQPVEDDLQVQLAHPGDDRLPRLLVAAHAKGRVLFGEALERDGQLLLIGLGLRLDSLVYDRLRKYHLLEHDRLAFGSDQRVAGPSLREADSRHQLACVDLLALLPAVRVQLQEPAYALAPPLRGVHHVRAAPERTRIHPYIRQLPDVRVGLHLEGERRQRAVLVGL